MNQKNIADELNRSPNVISNFLKNPEKYCSKKRSGRKSTIKAITKRSLIREAKKGDRLARQLKECQGLKVNPRRIQQILSTSKKLKYMKKKSSPSMTKQHMEKRMDWAEPKLTWNDETWGAYYI